MLGPLLFVIYVNDLPKVFSHSHLHLFADDVDMHASGADPTLVQSHLNSDLASLFEWATYPMVIYLSHSPCMLSSRRPRSNQLSYV